MNCETLSFPSGELNLYGRMRHFAEGAPTLVLLSGLGFHTFEYEPLAAHLATEGLNCLSFDYRGHGRSDGQRGAWTLDELAGDTRHAIDVVRERHRGPIALFGNSLGAMVAILTTANGMPSGQSAGCSRAQRAIVPEPLTTSPSSATRTGTFSWPEIARISSRLPRRVHGISR